MIIDDYLAWCEEWLKEIHRLTTDKARCVEFGYFECPDKGKAIPIAYLLWNRIPFYVVKRLFGIMGLVGVQRMFSPRNEKFLWCVKDPDNYTFNLDLVRDKDVKYPNQRKNGKLKCNPLGKNPSDVWQFPKVTSGTDRSSQERTPHPAQFRIAVVDRIIKACSRESDLIMDPFMGSGSTAEACILINRPAIGFEIRKDYVDLAAARLSRFWKFLLLEAKSPPSFRAS